MLSFLFDEIHCVFMYFIDNMEHQKPVLAYPKKYGNKVIVHQYPHWMLSHYFKTAYYRYHLIDDNVKLLSLKDIENNAKIRLGIDWVFNGAKQSDSLHRNLMLRRLKFESINEVSNRVYPLSRWSKQDCLTYIKSHRLMLPQGYGVGKSNGLDLTLEVLLYLKTNFPGDYQKILNVFPFSEKIIIDHENESDKISTVSDCPDQQKANPECSV
jgi:3'-phosphoadenosine 5'-phosphosulfate sulfotransferase (PAPS reductase)/FAD synthetase